ncbi:MAG: glucose-6-phosphate dehydrogenase assembly protein OpcA [Actinobacteria bacterium]|nr:glucose-6-phosphate dehydrogenase assembly protein OpcA [Actinomycetota bacterium]
MGAIADEELVFTLGSSRKVDLGRAEQELQELWHAAGDEARRQGEEGVLRLREFNFVAYAGGEDMADRISAVVARLAQRHPGRAIVLLDAGPGQAGAELVEAWVSAACYRTREGGRHVCWEQVTVPARGEAVGLLHTAAMRLLVPELPTVLWWPGEPVLDGHIFRQLGEVSDMVLVDSAGFRDPLGGLVALAGVAADRSRNFALDDLNWARLTPWREVTADLFEDPSRRVWLPRIERVLVEYGSEDTYASPRRALEPAAARALLLVGWLASRLGWRPVGDAGQGDDQALRVRFARGATAEAGEIEVLLAPRETPCGVPGGLVGVHLYVGPTGGASAPTVLSVARMGEACVCAARVRRGQGGAEELVRTVDVSPRPEDRLLSEELDLLGPDPVYEEALRMAAALAALPGAQGLRGRQGGVEAC